jgi:hypothetical protein
MLRKIEKMPVLDLMPNECKGIIREESRELFDYLSLFSNKESWVPDLKDRERFAVKVASVNFKAGCFDIDKVIQIIAYIDIFQFVVFISWTCINNSGLLDDVMEYAIKHNDFKECNIVCQRMTLINTLHETE